MIIVTTETVMGKKVEEVFGVAKGEVVLSKHVGSDFMAGLKTVVGGEINDYTDMMRKAREVAIERMTEDAKKMGVYAIVGMRLGSSTIMGGASEMYAYGTAVKVK